MAKKDGIGDKLGKAKDSVKDFAGNTVHNVANIPKNTARKIGKNVGGKIDLTKQKFDHSKAGHAAKGLKDFAKSKDKAGYAKGKVKSAANRTKENIKSLPGRTFNKAKNKLLNNNTIKRTIEAVTHMVNFIVTWWKVIAIVGIIVLVGFNVTVIAIGISQSIGPSPHYYCDLEASSSIKSSSVYQQYCKQKDIAWTVDNINGHYIVQDGSGPASACAMLNMALRYYTLESDNLDFGTTNVYKYLWQADGRYNINGSTLSDGTSQNKTIRQILGSDHAKNDEDSTASMTNGSRQFAAAHEKLGYNMSNWGYLRDDSVDYKSYAITSDFYEDLSQNEKWVWDLSLDNKAEGTSWVLDNWNKKFIMNSVKFNVEQMTCPNGDKGYAILKNRLISVLTDKANDSDNWWQYYSRSAGVMVEYTKTKGSIEVTHTILLTKALTTTSGKYLFYGVDSSLGTSGGWEGPFDSTRRFAADDFEITSLLNSSENKFIYNGYTYTINKIGYCTQSEYSFF